MRQDIRFCAARDGGRIAHALCKAGAPLVASGTWLSHLEQQWRNLPWRPWPEWRAGRHTVLRYDTRGCGLSDRSLPEVCFEQWVGDFESVVEAAGPRFVSALLGFHARARSALSRPARRTSTTSATCTRRAGTARRSSSASRA